MLRTTIVKFWGVKSYAWNFQGHPLIPVLFKSQLYKLLEASGFDCLSHYGVPAPRRVLAPRGALFGFAE